MPDKENDRWAVLTAAFEHDRIFTSAALGAVAFGILALTRPSEPVPPHPAASSPPPMLAAQTAPPPSVPTASAIEAKPIEDRELREPGLLVRVANFDGRVFDFSKPIGGFTWKDGALTPETGKTNGVPPYSNPFYEASGFFEAKTAGEYTFLWSVTKDKPATTPPQSCAESININDRALVNGPVDRPTSNSVPGKIALSPGFYKFSARLVCAPYANSSPMWFEARLRVLVPGEVNPAQLIEAGMGSHSGERD